LMISDLQAGVIRKRWQNAQIENLLANLTFL